MSLHIVLSKHNKQETMYIMRNLSVHKLRHKIAT